MTSSDLDGPGDRPLLAAAKQVAAPVGPLRTPSSGRRRDFSCMSPVGAWYRIASHHLCLAVLGQKLAASADSERVVRIWHFRGAVTKAFVCGDLVLVESSWLEERLDRSPFVHCSISLGSSFQWEDEVEDLARLNFSLPYQFHQLGEEATDRGRTTMQMDLPEE
jgi:hypothetical protein